MRPARRRPDTPGGCPGYPRGRPADPRVHFFVGKWFLLRCDARDGSGDRNGESRGRALARKDAPAQLLVEHQPGKGAPSERKALLMREQRDKAFQHDDEQREWQPKERGERERAERRRDNESYQNDDERHCIN